MGERTPNSGNDGEVSNSESQSGTESPLKYDRDGSPRFRPGISKVDTEVATCPACSEQLVHLPARDPANPYDDRTVIMCSECYRAVLVEVTDSEEPYGDRDEWATDFPADEPRTEDGQTVLPGVPEDGSADPDPEYPGERGGFTSYGYSGPVGVRQAGMSDFERNDDDRDDEPEVRTDGGEVTREVDNEPGGDTTERVVERFDSGVRVKTKIQRGTGTNDRDTVTGEVRRRTLEDATNELFALEDVLRGHLREIRGWDGEPEQADEQADTDGENQ